MLYTVFLGRHYGPTISAIVYEAEQKEDNSFRPPKTNSVFYRFGDYYRHLDGLFVLLARIRFSGTNALSLDRNIILALLAVGLPYGVPCQAAGPNDFSQRVHRIIIWQSVSTGAHGN